MRVAAYAAAGLSLVAVLIHLWVAPEHFEEWWGYGSFFVICAIAQMLFAPLLLRWPAGSLIPLAGIAGNLVVVLLYLVSRTWGMPLGPDWVLLSPDAAHLEDPEVLGMLATAAELGTIFFLVILLGGLYRKVVINALLFLGALLWTLRLTGILP
jgi:hypothetical protein